MHKKGFTLVEMLIVIVIIGILSAALIPRVVGVQARARDVARTADARNLYTALEIYILDHAQYPGVGEGDELGLNNNNGQLYASLNPVILAEERQGEETLKIMQKAGTDKQAYQAGDTIVKYEDHLTATTTTINKAHAVTRAQSKAIRVALQQYGNPTMSPITNFGDARLQKALLPYLTSIPKDTGRGLDTNIDDDIGACNETGDYFAYYADDNMMIITSTKESQKGNTDDCVGSIVAEGPYSAITTYTRKGANLYRDQFKDLSSLSTEEIYKNMEQIYNQVESLVNSEKGEVEMQNAYKEQESAIEDLEQLRQKQEDMDPEDKEGKIAQIDSLIQDHLEQIDKLDQIRQDMKNTLERLQDEYLDYVEELQRRGEEVPEFTMGGGIKGGDGGIKGGEVVIVNPKGGGMDNPKGGSYDEEGYDEYGYDQYGYNRTGYDRYGYDRDGYDQNGYDKDGNPKVLKPRK